VRFCDRVAFVRTSNHPLVARFRLGGHCDNTTDDGQAMLWLGGLLNER